MKTFLKTTGWLVMAAALIFGTAACSSDDDAVKQPQNPAEPQVYTMTVTASKGDDATTRALTLNDNELNAAWAAGEKVYVHNESKDAPLGGYLEAKTAGTTVTLDGELTGTIDVDDILSLGFPQLYHDYTGQDGTLATIASTYDYVWGRAKVTAINDGKITAEDLNTKATPVQFENQQAIVKFTLLDKADDSAINVTSLTIDAKDESDDELIQTYNIATNEMTCGPITITPSATNEIYAALAINSPSEPVDITLTATDENGDTYTYTKTGVKFEYGKFYTRTVKMIRVVDLSKTSIYKSNVFTAQNGDVLTGTVPEGKAVYVASGAEVTLRNATIDCDWTYALFCWGNNTINLEGTNTARSIDEISAYDGINCYAGALTIQGSGSLTATGCNGGAGITCYDTGSITIKGGTITATGSYNEYGPFGGAGIGGVSSCGDIIIEGGTIEATGGNYAAGIGGGSASNGEMSSCGNITIKSTVTSVTATRGYNAPNSIGAGNNGTCGTVTIEDWSKVTRR